MLNIVWYHYLRIWVKMRTKFPMDAIRGTFLLRSTLSYPCLKCPVFRMGYTHDEWFTLGQNYSESLISKMCRWEEQTCFRPMPDWKMLANRRESRRDRQMQSTETALYKTNLMNRVISTSIWSISQQHNRSQCLSIWSFDLEMWTFFIRVLTDNKNQCWKVKSFKHWYNSWRIWSCWQREDERLYFLVNRKSSM